MPRMNTPRNPIGQLALGLAAVHSTATLELGLAMARREPSAVPGWLDLLSLWAGSILVAATLLGALYTLIAVPLLAMGRKTGLPAAAAAGVASACLILLNTFAGYNGSMVGNVVQAVIIVELVIAAGAGAYWLTLVVDFESPPGRRLVKAVLTTPILLALVLLLAWFRISYLNEMLESVSLRHWMLLIMAVAITTAALLWRNESLRMHAPRALGAWSAVLLVALTWHVVAPSPAMRQLATAASGQQKIRHVVLITVDTLRADALSGGISPHCESPYLDALAADSVKFDSAYAPSPWTSPSMASILNGLSPAVHGVGRRRSQFPLNLPNLPDFFREAGFLSAAFGGNVLLTPQDALSRGFDVFRFPGLEPPNTLARQALVRYLGPLQTSDQHQTEDITADAEKWVELHSEQDFFLWLHYFDPHAPYLPPTEFLPDENRGDLYRIALSFDEHRGAESRFNPPPPPRQGLIRDLYCGEVRYVDNRIGRLIKRMKRLGIYDEALVVLTSDHGEEFWEHGGAFHGHSLLDELLRVPLLFKLPNGSPRTTINEAVSIVAVTPSILDLAEIDFDPAQFSRTPLRPFWSKHKPRPRPIYAGHNFVREKQEAIIFAEWKYIRHQNPHLDELYHLAEDPAERVNRLPSEPERASQMRTLLEEHHELSAGLRKRIGKAGSVPKGRRQEMEQRLRSLGYVE